MTFKKAPTNIKEIKKRVEEYFESRVVPSLDKNGNIIVDEKGEAVKKIGLPYTLTGLALALGLDSREALFNFDDPEIDRFIKMAVMRVEEYAEEKLFSKEAFSGVKLFLMKNFERWNDIEKSEDEDSFILDESYSKWTV